MKNISSSKNQRKKIDPKEKSKLWKSLAFKLIQQAIRRPNNTKMQSIYYNDTPILELLTELNEHEKEIAYYGTIGKGLELPDKSSHAYRQREVVSSKVKKTLSDEWSVRSKGRYNRSSKQRLKRNHTLAPLRLSESKTNFEQITGWSNRHI